MNRISKRLSFTGRGAIVLAPKTEDLAALGATSHARGTDALRRPRVAGHELRLKRGHDLQPRHPLQAIRRAHRRVLDAMSMHTIVLAVQRELDRVQHFAQRLIADRMDG